MTFLDVFKVLWKPTSTFRQFISEPNFKPLLFVGLLSLLFSINAYFGQFEQIINNPLLLVLALIQSFLSLALIPTLSAIFVFLLTRIILTQKKGLIFLVNFFILCMVPTYMETIMVAFFGFKGFGLGAPFPYDFRLANPFFYGMIATITPFFLWMAFIWWVAIKQLFKMSTHKRPTVK